MSVMTTQIFVTDVLDHADVDAEVAFYSAREDALWDDPARYDSPREMTEANEDYIYVRDEALSAIEAALADFDPDEDAEHPAHRIVVALQQTDVLDSTVSVGTMCRIIAQVLVTFPEVPDESDFESVFEAAYSRGWLHI